MSAIKVMIVDDEPRIRRGVERLIASCGEDWEVVAALGDGVEALAYMEEHDGGVDLLITDIKMPEMDGLALIKEGRSKFGFSPLLLTGYDDFEYMQTALREGAIDYLLKPIDREQFRERMDALKDRIGQERLRRQRWSELNRKADKLKETRRKQTLASITSSEGEDLSHLGFWTDDFPRGLYALLYISLDAMPVKTRAYTDNDWKAYYYALDNIIEEIVSGGTEHSGAAGYAAEAKGWSWHGRSSDFWVLLWQPAAGGGEELERQTQETADAIRTAVRSYTPFTVSVAYGGLVEDLYLLPDAKQEALSLIPYRLVQGGNRTFTPALGLGHFSGKLDAELKLLEQLKQAIGQNKEEEALARSKELFALLEKLDSPAAIQKTVQNAVVLLHSVGLESCGRACFSVEEALAAVKRANHLQELRTELNGLIHVSLRQIREMREQSSALPVEQAKSFIEDHLGGDLTIRQIAEQIYMNPNYFCQYFKQQTGETVLDYITRRRMEMAARLLRDPSIKLQELSERVGYMNSKYFGRLFKQWSGDSPSKYRERLLQEE